MGIVSTVRFILEHPLSRGRKLANLVSFVRWQVGARLVPGPVAVEFVNGTRLLAEPGLTGATGNIYVGLHEFADMGFILHALRPDDLFVDVGANIGSYTILGAGAVGAHVIAFEPIDVAYGWLTRNIGLNSLGDRVEARRQAVGDRIGPIQMTVGGDTVNHVLMQPAEGSLSREVSAITLDAALAQRSPSFMKIDVEGFETAVVAGGGTTFANPRLQGVLMELIGGGGRYGYDESAIVARMHAWGFRICAYDPLTRRLDEISVDRAGVGHPVRPRSCIRPRSARERSRFPSF